MTDCESTRSTETIGVLNVMKNLMGVNEFSLAITFLKRELEIRWPVLNSKKPLSLRLSFCLRALKTLPTHILSIIVLNEQFNVKAACKTQNNFCEEIANPNFLLETGSLIVVHPTFTNLWQT